MSYTIERVFGNINYLIKLIIVESLETGDLAWVPSSNNYYYPIRWKFLTAANFQGCLGEGKSETFPRLLPDCSAIFILKYLGRNTFREPGNLIKIGQVQFDFKFDSLVCLLLYLIY